MLRDAIKKKTAKRVTLSLKGGGGYDKNHLSYSFERVTKMAFKVRGGDMVYVILLNAAHFV